jgi:hypothetical protein
VAWDEAGDGAGGPEAERRPLEAGGKLDEDEGGGALAGWFPPDRCLVTVVMCAEGRYGKAEKAVEGRL